MTRITPPLRQSPGGHGDSADPAIAALTQLLQSERELALTEEPSLVERHDPGRVWLLWFAIGATDEVCGLVERNAHSERNRIFRQVVAVIFDGGAKSLAANQADPAMADKRLIDLFESAGAAAVQACMRGDTRLGYYLEALKVSADRGTPPLLS